MAKVERKSTETNAVAEVEVQDSAVGAEEPAKFEVGKTYFVDMGDDIYRYFKVVSRKGKEITVESNDGGVYESKVGRILPRNIHGNFETAKGIMMSELVHACDEVNAEFLKAEEERKAREYAKLLEECAEDEEFEETEEGELEMATTKFEVGKVYITMADKFGDGEQTGKSVVIERTEGTVTFKHLASGEIFVREVEVFDAVQVEGCDGLDAMDNFIADNFGEEITTADIETVEQVAEIETADDTVESVESAVETTDSTAEPEQAKVEVCKAYDAKDIIAACYSVDIAKIEIFDAQDIEPDDSPEIVETLICIEHTRQDILNYKKEVIHSESVIAEDEKLIQLYAEENKTRHKDKSLDWLIEMQQDEIETCRADIAYNKRRIEREEARLAKLEEKLAALKISKVAA